MGEPSRYDVGGDEADIRTNKLGIANPKTLEDAETILLSDAYTRFLGFLEKGKLPMDLRLIFDVHKYFLGPLYSWAGKIRTVNISKDGMLFIPTKNIPKALKAFEKILNKNVPEENEPKKKIADKLAEIHCEFNAIHPFREGNGRVIRLFLDLIALQVGYQLIDFGKSSKKDYIQACVAGMQKDYGKMSKVIYKGLLKRK